MFDRRLEKIITNKLNRKKAIILVGARQVGKTTLLKKILNNHDYLFLDGDDPTSRKLLTNPSTEEIKAIIGKHKYIFLDEAQRIENIGITLKIMIDQFTETQLLVSGSSSFDLGNSLNEPLTGRKWEYELYPISWDEFENKVGFIRAEQQLENRLLYGFYPDVINNPGEEVEILKELVNSYLYRDILAYSGLRKPEILQELVQSLALQIGSEVNYNELSSLIGVSKNTIQSYIEILEKGFVIFRLRSFSRNLRNEIKKSRKIYFWDNGVRNTIIGNFNQLDLREDKGSLWENFLVSERLKENKYLKSNVASYFWRTKQQQEIDYLEVKGNDIFAYEFKWNKNKAKIPITFTNNYKTEIKLINRKNFREFVKPE
ncbi:ATP-binding protein [bacterium]|nr:ATP-binding protein [bacterium]